MTTNPIAQRIYRRDRNVVLIGLAGVILVAVTYTIFATREMLRVSELQAAANAFVLVCTINFNDPFVWSDYLALFAMWVVMQIAMMSPTAVPMTLAFTKMDRYKTPERAPWKGTIVFFGAYVIVWIIYSAIAALVQWWLHAQALITPTGVAASPYVGGAILIGAGLFQFSSIKENCLNHCRSPLAYMMNQWEDGLLGALRMGLKHGAYCVGCCWVLMLVLFVAGVMNLLWMAVITAFVLIEKLAPGGDKFGKVIGVGFIAWGVVMMIL